MMVYQNRPMGLEFDTCGLDFQKRAVAYPQTKKCVHLLRPWCDAKNFSMSKPVFTNMSAGVV